MLLVTCHISFFVDACLHVIACFCHLGRKPGIETSPETLCIPSSRVFMVQVITILFTDWQMFYILFVNKRYFLDHIGFNSVESRAFSEPQPEKGGVDKAGVSHHHLGCFGQIIYVCRPPGEALNFPALLNSGIQMSSGPTCPSHRTKMFWLITNQLHLQARLRKPEKMQQLSPVALTSLKTLQMQPKIYHGQHIFPSHPMLNPAEVNCRFIHIPYCHRNPERQVYGWAVVLWPPFLLLFLHMVLMQL